MLDHRKVLTWESLEVRLDKVFKRGPWRTLNARAQNRRQQGVTDDF